MSGREKTEDQKGSDESRPTNDQDVHAVLARRSRLQAVDGVDGRCVALHQVGNRAVHEALTVQFAQAGEGWGSHLDREVPATAVHVGSRVGDLSLDRFAHGVEDRKSVV